MLPEGRMLVACPWLQIEQFNMEFIGALLRMCDQQIVHDGEPVFVIEPAAWTWLTLRWPWESSHMPVIYEPLA